LRLAANPGFLTRHSQGAKMRKIILLFMISVFQIFWISRSYAQGRGYGEWGMYGPGMMGWGWSFGWIFMMVFWVLVIIGMIFLIKWLAGLSRAQKTMFEKPNDSALDILRQRYARGEINKEEFDQKKKDLM
jgi:putative membrane protein